MPRVKKVIKSNDNDLIENLLENVPQNQTIPEAKSETSGNDTGNNSPLSKPADNVVENKLKALLNEDEYATAPDKPKRGRRSKAEIEAAQAPPKKLIIPGRLVIKTCDRVFTRALTMLDAMVSKDEAIDPALLRIEDDQLEDLIPLAEEMISRIKAEDNPALYFFGSLGAIYLTNFLMVKSLIKKQKRENGKS